MKTDIKLQDNVQNRRKDGNYEIINMINVKIAGIIPSKSNQKYITTVLDS